MVADLSWYQYHSQVFRAALTRGVIDEARFHTSPPHDLQCPRHSPTYLRSLSTTSASVIRTFDPSQVIVLWIETPVQAQIWASGRSFGRKGKYMGFRHPRLSPTSCACGMHVFHESEDTKIKSAIARPSMLKKE